MRSLSDLQRDFADAVRLAPSSARHLAIADAGLSAERRLAIYRNHHSISLGAALAANFPTVAAVLGEPMFHRVALDFLAESPPTEPCLAQYGAGFAGYLAQDPRLGALPYLVDVAKLDRAIALADAADDIPTFGASDLERLAQAGLAELRLRPHPSCSLIESDYPLLRIRTLAQQPEGDAISLDEPGDVVLVWRRGLSVECVRLERGPHRFLDALMRGEPLASAAADLAADDLAVALAEYVLTGAFAELDL